MVFGAAMLLGQSSAPSGEEIRELIELNRQLQEQVKSQQSQIDELRERDRPQVFEPPRVLVWELVMGCIWIAVEAGPTEGGRRPTGVGAAVSWAA